MELIHYQDDPVSQGVFEVCSGQQLFAETFFHPLFCLFQMAQVLVGHL